MAGNRPRSLCDNKLLRCEMASKYRESWPNLSSWNQHNDAVKYPTPLLAGCAEKAPSMAALLNTTVPQRLVSRPLRGNAGQQHTPTRNSLRHSRMISLGQQGKVPRKYLPPVIHHYRMGTLLVLIQLVLGCSLMALAIYLLMWMPLLNSRDVPHWSAASLVLSSVFGLFLMCCCRKQHPGMRGGCCVFVVRVQYIVCNLILAMIATAACLCACIFASLHVSELLRMKCGVSPNVTPNATYPPPPPPPSPEQLLSDDENATSRTAEELLAPEEATYRLEEQLLGWNSSCLCRGVDSNQLYTYDPLSCRQVEKVLLIYLLTSAVANGVAVFVCGWYTLLLWSNRFAYAYASNYYEESILMNSAPKTQSHVNDSKTSCPPLSWFIS